MKRTSAENPIEKLQQQIHDLENLAEVLRSSMTVAYEGGFTYCCADDMDDRTRSIDALDKQITDLREQLRQLREPQPAHSNGNGI